MKIPNDIAEHWHIGDTPSVDLSCISQLSSTMGMQRVMTVRTLKESLEGNSKMTNKEQRKMFLLRRRLKIFQLINNNNDNIDRESVDVGDSIDLSLSVSFGHVQVREYPIILGDNTAVTEGPPLSIDWNFNTDVEEYTVEQYEATSPVKRSIQEMIMPVKYRMECLIRCGVSTKDIHKRVQEVDIKRKERLETTAMLYRRDLHESIEKVKRRLRNFFTQKKKKERQLMKHSKALIKIQRDEVNLKASIEEEALAIFFRENHEADINANIITL